jgi:hypothetical protein
MKIKTVLHDKVKVSQGLGVEEIFAHVCACILSDVGNLSVHKQVILVMCFVSCIVIKVCVLRDRTQIFGPDNLPIPHMRTKVFIYYTSK